MRSNNSSIRYTIESVIIHGIIGTINLSELNLSLIIMQNIHNAFQNE